MLDAGTRTKGKVRGRRRTQSARGQCSSKAKQGNTQEMRYPQLAGQLGLEKPQRCVWHDMASFPAASRPPALMTMSESWVTVPLHTRLVRCGAGNGNPLGSGV